jgi:hypothetical protein
MGGSLAGRDARTTSARGRTPAAVLAQCISLEGSDRRSRRANHRRAPDADAPRRRAGRRDVRRKLRDGLGSVEQPPNAAVRMWSEAASKNRVRHKAAGRQRYGRGDQGTISCDRLTSARDKHDASPVGGSPRDTACNRAPQPCNGAGRPFCVIARRLRGPTDQPGRAAAPDSGSHRGVARGLGSPRGCACRACRSQ